MDFFDMSEWVGLNLDENLAQQYRAARVFCPFAALEAATLGIPPCVLSERTDSGETLGYELANGDIRAQTILRRIRS